MQRPDCFWWLILKQLGNLSESVGFVCVLIDHEAAGFVCLLVIDSEKDGFMCSGF